MDHHRAGPRERPGEKPHDAKHCHRELILIQVKKLAQVRCKYCAREMAQHTSRQRAHLLGCQQYLDSMKEEGIENSITRQAADPATFFKNSKVVHGIREPKPPKTLNLHEHSMAVRIQALALAEASISAERIHEITGIAIGALRGEPLKGFEVERRLAWAEHRDTTRQEDKAYSLLGLFDIHMSLRYGEGREEAFMRLRRKIKKSLNRR